MIDATASGHLSALWRLGVSQSGTSRFYTPTKTEFSYASSPHRAPPLPAECIHLASSCSPVPRPDLDGFSPALTPRETNRSGPIRVMAIDPPEPSTRPSLPTKAVGLMPPALVRRTCPRAAHSEYQTLLTQPFKSNQYQNQIIHYPPHRPKRRTPRR